MRLLLVALLLLISPSFAAPESIEGFSFGGSADEIVGRIGEPTSVEGPVFNAARNVWVWNWDYARYGALFEVEAETQDGTKRIRSLTIVAPCTWKLTNGLGIGDNKDRILATYVKVNQLQDGLWFATLDKRNVTGFEFQGARIKSIFIGSTKR